MYSNTINAGLSARNHASFGNKKDGTKEEIARLNEFRNSPDFRQRLLASLDEYQVRAIATGATIEQTNIKKHNNITRAMWASIPLAAGVAMITALKGKPGFSRSQKLLAGGIEAGKWIGAFAVFDAVRGLRNGINKRNEKFREFTNNHPILSFAATVGAGLGGLILASKGASVGGKKLLSVLEKRAPNVLKSLAEMGTKASEKINNSKLINSSLKTLSKLPNPVKSGIKFLGRNAHWATAITAFLYGTKQVSKFNNAYANNYMAIKKEQALAVEELRKAAEVEEAEA